MGILTTNKGHHRLHVPDGLRRVGDMKKTKKCSTCKRTAPLTDFYRDKRQPDGLYVNCKRCANISTERWKHNTGYYEKKNQSLRARARIQVNLAVNKGLLSRPDICSRYGDRVACYGGIEGHHPDYSKPLEVIWLCRAHHNKHHYDTKQSK